jgi:hypothetical protein
VVRWGTCWAGLGRISVSPERLMPKRTLLVWAGHNIEAIFHSFSSISRKKNVKEMPQTFICSLPSWNLFGICI